MKSSRRTSSEDFFSLLLVVASLLTLSFYLQRKLAPKSLEYGIWLVQYICPATDAN